MWRNSKMENKMDMDTMDHNHESIPATEHTCNQGHIHTGLKAYMHEGASVISAELEVYNSVKEIRQQLTTDIEELSHWVDVHHGIVGHIKAFIKEGGNGYMLSSTGEDVQCKEISESVLQISIAVIVFQIDLKQIKQQIEKILEKYK